MGSLRATLGWLVPYRVVIALQNRRARGKVLGRPTRLTAQSTLAFSYQAAVEFVVSQGLDRLHCVQGSMPEPSLAFAASFFPKHLTNPPWKGLHVGNFVGISLAYLARTVLDAHPESLIVSIDPDIPHRGVNQPSRMLIALLNAFGLQGSVSVLTGFSLEKNLSNDGITYWDSNYNPRKHYETELSLENQLLVLRSIAPHSFDFAVIDGNHDPTYLRREIAVIGDLLRPGGLLILDDVDRWWPELRSVYMDLSEDRFLSLGSDGRVGILVLKADSNVQVTAHS